MAPIRYELDLRASAQHLATVTLHVPAELAAGARLALATWTPGSYVVRNYVHHMQSITAMDAAGRPVAIESDGHTAWTLPSDITGAVDVVAEIYGNELTVRTNHFDHQHALVIPAATFPYLDGQRDTEIAIAVTAPDNWGVWSLLPRDDDGSYRATGLDHLIDSAFEAGQHEHVSYKVAGVPHHFVYSGDGGRPDLDRIATDAQAMGEAAVALFDGDLPTEDYTFLCTSWESGGGGLEHRDGAVLMVPATIFGDPERYLGFNSLIAHEYLHLWNVKRMTPEALIRPDFQIPAHTTSLWVAEGWTAHYDEVIPVRAGVWPLTHFLTKRAALISNVLDNPGRALQSLHEASHDAWTKYYIRDDNSANNGVSYYDHGALVAWCLDLMIRKSDPSGPGLDGALRTLWRDFGTTGVGYTEADVIAATSEAAGRDLTEVFETIVSGRQAPPIEDLLEAIGLKLHDKTPTDAPPTLGVKLSEADGRVKLGSVLRGRGAWSAGLSGGDQLLAIDGLKVAPGSLPTLLRPFTPGDEVAVTVFNGPTLRTVNVTLGPPTPQQELRAIDDASAAARTAFENFTGQALPEPTPS